MKAILLSIQPKYCELIASGKKTIEVRKTEPKLQTPFKCYIYMTATRERCRFWEYITAYQNSKGDIINGSQKIIGEFICDEIEDICFMHGQITGTCEPWYKEIQGTCLSSNDLLRYGKGKILYGLHISDLKIYDKPKELNDFKKAGYMTEEQWLYALYPNTHCHYAAWAKHFDIKRPPQSWCYVEELN